MLRTKVERGRGGHLMVSATLTLNLGFQVILRSKWFFSNRNFYFDAGFEERRILRIRYSIGQVRFKVIWRSIRRKWVKFYWFKMWIFYSVLLRSNKFPKVGQLAKHERPWLFKGHELSIFCATQEQRCGRNRIMFPSGCLITVSPLASQFSGC